MSLILQSSGGGSITIAEPATASNFTQTLPSASGTVMVSGNMPAFSAYQSSNQSFSANTQTKVTCNIEEFDTNNNYDNATNYRFTPTVAGYYQVNGATTLGSSVTSCTLSIYKNGTQYKEGALSNSNIAYPMATANCLVYLNGTTDYIEMYVYANGAQSTQGVSYITYFQAAMIRNA
jgi:hypothetical protein